MVLSVAHSLDELAGQVEGSLSAQERKQAEEELRQERQRREAEANQAGSEQVRGRPG